MLLIIYQQYRKIPCVTKYSEKNQTMVHVPLTKFQFLGHLPNMPDLSKIEAHTIKRVKEMRIEAGLSQIDLSQKLGLSDSFISHVETPRRRAKYNINHLNALAKIFKCSPRDFLPEKPLS